MLILENDCLEAAQFLNDLADYAAVDFEIELELKISNEGVTKILWGGQEESEQMQLDVENSGLIKLRLADERKGVFAIIQSNAFRPNLYNQVNIIRRADRYYVFVNKELFYLNDFYEFEANILGFELAENTLVEIKELQVYKND